MRFYFAKVNDFSQSILVSTVCYFAKARRAFSQSILVSTVCYFAKSPKGIFRKVYWSVPFVTLRKPEGRFRKVYWSVPFVTLRKSTTFRKVYWSVPFVRLFVCLSVCHASYRPQFCTDQDYFFTVDLSYPANFTFFFL